MKKLLTPAILFLSLIFGSPCAMAGIIIDFDSLPTEGLPGGITGGPVIDYLRTFGITVSDLTAGTELQVIDARQVYADIQPIVPPSPFNILGQTGSLDPISYRLNFALPQDYFGLTRPYIRSGVTGVALPEWQVSAFDAAGSLLGSVGENAFSIFSDLPARTFTLNGPDIWSVVVASNSHRFAAFGSAILDDFMISAAPPGAAVPEPGSAGLLASAAVFGAAWSLQRSFRRR